MADRLTIFVAQPVGEYKAGACLLYHGFFHLNKGATCLKYLLPGFQNLALRQQPGGCVGHVAVYMLDVTVSQGSKESFGNLLQLDLNLRE